MSRAVQLELRALERRRLKANSKIERVLWEEFHRHLYQRNAADQLRLITLLVWAERYHVTLRYILRVLVNHYQRFLKKAHSMSLGVKIATLVGKHSEQVLREHIARDYQDKENVKEWRWRRRRKMLALRVGKDDGIDQRVRGLLDYPTVKGFVKAYRNRVYDQRSEFDHEINSTSNKLRAYRGNPWL